MDTVLRLAALCLLGALLAVLLRRGGGELALLLVHARAAIDADDFDVRQKLRQILQVLGDLLGQLPRGA